MIIVLLAISTANASSKMVHEETASIPSLVGSDEKTVLADETRIGERTQESKQNLKDCMTQEACHNKVAICSKKCIHLPVKDHDKCIAKCKKCVPNC